MNKHFDTIIKALNRHKHGLRDPQIMHPEREWVIGILLAVTIFLSSASWSLVVYFENRNVTVGAESEVQSESVVYREAMVAEALAKLDKRTEVLDGLMPEGDTVAEEVIATTSVAVASSSDELIEDVGTSTESE